jgi:hypothetical protein
VILAKHAGSCSQAAQQMHDIGQINIVYLGVVASQTQPNAHRWVVGVDDGIIMYVTMVTNTYRLVIRLIRSMKSVDWLWKLERIRYFFTEKPKIFIFFQKHPQ